MTRTTYSFRVEDTVHKNVGECGVSHAQKHTEKRYPEDWAAPLFAILSTNHPPFLKYVLRSIDNFSPIARWEETKTVFRYTLTKSSPPSKSKCLVRSASTAHKRPPRPKNMRTYHANCSKALHFLALLGQLTLLSTKGKQRRKWK